VELNCHFLLLRFQRFKSRRNRGSTEPGLRVLGDAAHKQVVFCLAGVGPLDIELVQHHLYLSRSCLQDPLAIFVVWIFAGIVWAFQGDNPC